MDTWLHDFRQNCLQASLDLLWRQWCSLGVAGHGQKAPPDRMIDPEALVLATTVVGREDPRLFEEVLDWLAQFGTLLNLQRLKNLQSSTALGDPTVLGAMAEWLGKNAGQPRWKAVTAKELHHAPKQSLFYHEPSNLIHDPDPEFATYGVDRPRVQLRGMSGPPDHRQIANLVVTLRSLIGVSARVEIILALAGGSPIHASELARMTGYAPRTVQTLLQEMTLSGHLLTAEVPVRYNKVRRGANRRYQIRPSDWAFLSDGQPIPQWFRWAPFFHLIQEVLATIPPAGAKPKSQVTISSKLREVLAKHGEAYMADGLLASLDLRARSGSEELLKSLASHLPPLITRL